MNLDDFIKELNKLIRGAEGRLESAIEIHQNRTVRELVRLTRDPESKYYIRLDSSGNIRNLRTNRQAIRRLQRDLRSISNLGRYNAQAERFTDTFDELEKLQSKYFAAAFPNASSLVFSDFTKIAKQRAITTLTNNALNQGIEVVASSILDEALAGTPLRDLHRNFRDQMLTVFEDVDNTSIRRAGSLRAWISRQKINYVRGALNSYAGALNQQVKEATGAEWFLYSGGEVEDTRDFCDERAGNYYPYAIIEEWVRQDWKGKIPGTTASNFQIRRGGYNCQHTLIPVSESIVPESAKREFADLLNT